MEQLRPQASYQDTHRNVGPPGHKMRRKDYDDDEIRQAHEDYSRLEEDEDRAMREEEGHYTTERRQGLIGQGARQDFPQHGNLWDNAYLDAIHGFPAEPPIHDDTASRAYNDAYETGQHVNRTRPAFYSDQHFAALQSDGSETDGKIVGLCPGCNRAIRKHQTAHGDELRHLHNNHVRCFGKTAAEGPALLEAADLGGKAINGVEHELEKPADEWAYKAEGALQMYADYLGRPDAQNPTGKGPDEYKARTWNAYETTRPMQSVEDRNVNTPVMPAEPIKTRNINTPTPGLQGRRDDLQVTRDEDDDDDED